MSANIERFRKELADLIDQAVNLEFSAARYADKEGFESKIRESFAEDERKVESILNNMPEFRSTYEVWYSESGRVIAQLIPDRLADFKSHYEPPKNRKSLTVENYTVHDMIHGLSRSYGGVHLSTGLSRLKIQVNILKAAQRRFDSTLFEIRQLVQADLFDSELDVARELLKNGFSRAAGAVSGVVLERHLKQVCDDHFIKIAKAKPTLSVLNDTLKDAGIIDVPQWRFNQHLGDIRNNCDHARQPDPTPDQVKDLIDGTMKVLKTIS